MDPRDLEDALSSPDEDIEALEGKLRHRNAEVQKLRAENRKLGKQIINLEEGLEIRKGVSIPVEGKPIQANDKILHEATAIAMLSDVHWGEVVDGATIGGVNEYTPEIAAASVSRFFELVRWHIDMLRSRIEITELVLILGGDLITGHLHDELLEVNAIGPIPEAIAVQAAIKSGIDYLLLDKHLHLNICCVYGNHGRITPKRRHSTGARHSIERYLYSNLATLFEDCDRTTWTIADGAHVYQDIYGDTIRIHHGDDVRFGGGAGGLIAPMHKACKSWDTIRPVKCSFFGHWHQLRDFGFACVNGSTIGYSAYSLAIKAEFEPPRQLFCLWDKKHGKTIFSPILTRS